MLPSRRLPAAPNTDDPDGPDGYPIHWGYPNTWPPETVCLWLKRVGLGQYADLFLDQELDGKTVFDDTYIGAGQRGGRDGAGPRSGRAGGRWLAGGVCDAVRDAAP